jgi:hypothetical protein
MGSEIPLNSNFKKLSCQLGGLTLNGNVADGTAIDKTVITINDPAVISGIAPVDTSVIKKWLKVKIAAEYYYIPLYQ